MPIDKQQTPEALKNHLDQISKTLSKISFGGVLPTVAPAAGSATMVPDPESNMDGHKVYVAFPAAPNTDITFTHALGRVPTGWVALRLANGGIIFQGSIAFTATTMTLRSSVGSQIALLHIF